MSSVVFRLCLLLFLVCPAFAEVDFRVYANGSTRSGPVYLKLVNASGSPVTFQPCTVVGTNSATLADSFTLTPTTSFTMSVAAGGAGSVTIPANSTRILPCTATVTFPASWSGFKVLAFNVYGKINGNATVQTYGCSVSLSITNAAIGGLSATATGADSAAGLTDINGAVMSAGAIIGALSVAAPAPFARIKVTGLRGSISGYAVLAETILSELTFLTDDINAVSPDWQILNASDPASFLSAEFGISINGTRCYYVPAITPDINGNFDLVIDASAWEYTRSAEDPLEPLPKPKSELDTAPWLNDPNITPPPIEGTPEADDKVDSDGAGPGAGLSVRDIYRAMRAGTRDALNEGTEYPFSALDWMGTDHAHGHSTSGGTGQSIGNGLAAMTDVVLPTSFGGASMGGPSTMVVGTQWGAVNIGVSEHSVWIRRIFLVFILVLFWLALMSQIRSAFAGH